MILDDLKDTPLFLTALEHWIQRIRPKVIGFTTYQSTIGRVRFLARYIKSKHRNILIALGGPQVIGMSPGALEELEDVDILIRGEGEVVMLQLSRALEAASSLETVEGIVCRCGAGIVDTGKGPIPPDDLDEYPSPYLNGLMNMNGKDTAILLSSRGCRHACWFCITPHVSKGKIRFHSIDRVMAEMECLTKAGVRRFWFADPSFTEDRERTERLLEEKIRRNITTPFWFQTRSDLVDKSLLKLFKKAGADTVAFGLESGSAGVLERTNKGILLEQTRENVKAAQSLDMEAELFTIFGLPGESVEAARETLEFVRSMGIPILSNSGSQQMQLYFGSVYERNPKGFGIKPISQHKAAYLSIGEDYETASMSSAEIRQVRNMWALANEQLEQDVYYKQRIFEILAFLLSNKDDLKTEPAYYAYGALAAAAIEEFQLLIDFLEGYAAQSNGNMEPVEELISALSFFMETDEPIAELDRVIFDSRSWMSGVPFTGISGKYWDMLLGRGLLLPEFEQGFVGAKQGDNVEFTFTFPMDYVQEELRGKDVKVKAVIHKAFKSPHVATLDDIKSLGIRNHYAFKDLNLLREQNEILYYLALRDADPTTLLRTPIHYLMLAHKYAKLGKKEEIDKLVEFIKGKPTAINALADTMINAGKHEWALELFGYLSEDLPSTTLKRVRCLLQMREEQRAMTLINSLSEGTDLEFQETLLQTLKAARPASGRIPSLERHVLDLKVAAALGRELMTRGGPTFLPPVVHGWDEGIRKTCT